MDLLAHYDAMRAAALPRLAQGEAKLDPLLDAGPADTRRGLTLLARPPRPVLAAIAEVQAVLQLLEPDQYYQPASDIHLTILSLISCYPGFTLDTVDTAAYAALAAQVLATTAPFTVAFRGLTASPGGLLVQGFPLGSELADLRQRLRVAFWASGLPQSIDQRYRLQTAHSTIVRFRAPLRQPARLVQAMAHYRWHSFGTFTAGGIELVFNDWYQRANNTALLACLPLAAAPPARL